MSQPTICIGHDVNFLSSVITTRKFMRRSTTEKECAKQNAFQPGRRIFSDGAWCMERFHDRPFQDFVAHETRRLIPGFDDDASEFAHDLAGMFTRR
jgi:hypothetical protein